MIRRRGPIKVVFVATNAVRRQSKSVELPNGSHLVAGVAIYDSMSTNQGETILMSIDVLERNFPSICVVAKFALGPVLSAVEICVTVLALIRHACELKTDMAVTASNISMLTSKWKARLRMIEPDLVRRNLPALGGMTHIAWHVELSVWAAG